MKKPFFSIITCTKNSERFIIQNLQSVQSQTLLDYEHIIIDGDSTDRTIKHVQQMQKKSNKIVVFAKQPKGISNALNEGIHRSKGVYLIHLNSDDFFSDKNILLTVYKKLQQENFPDVLYGQIQTIEEDGSLIGVFPKHRLLQLANPFILKYFNFVPHQSVFIKKDVFDRFGYFDESLKSSMDYDLWLRVMSKTRWTFLNKIISNYRIRAGAQSSSKVNHSENYDNFQKVLKKHLNPIELYISLLVAQILDRKNTLLR